MKLLPLEILFSFVLICLTSCGTDHEETQPDVTFGSLSSAPAAPVAGSPFSLRFSIVNQGNSEARHVVWRLARDGVFISQDYLDYLDSGSESPIQGLTLTEYLPGPHSYEITLDPTN